MNTLSSRANDLTKSWEDAVDSYNYSGCFLSCGCCWLCVVTASCAHLSFSSSRHVTAHPQSSGTLMETDEGTQLRGNRMKVRNGKTPRVLTLRRAAMLALLSMRSEVRTGRSILKPSSASSPPPSWIHSRAKTVAAAACSSPLPGSGKILFRFVSFSCRVILFYFLLGVCVCVCHL